ncbi:MAG TPA: hypothetical protein VGL83_07015 [Stellaceae bacterium]
MPSKLYLMLSEVEARRLVLQRCRMIARPSTTPALRAGSAQDEEKWEMPSKLYLMLSEVEARRLVLPRDISAGRG